MRIQPIFIALFKQALLKKALFNYLSLILCENFLRGAIQNLEDYFKRLHNYSIPHTIQNQTYVTTFLIRINSILYFNLQNKPFTLSLITYHGYCKPFYCARHRLFGALHLRCGM